MTNQELPLIETPEISRRAAVVGLVGGAAWLLAGCSVGEKSPLQQPPTEQPVAEQSLDPAVWQEISRELETANGQTFGPGQTIPGPVPMTISDRSWTITFDTGKAKGLSTKVGSDKAEVMVETNNTLVESAYAYSNQLANLKQLAEPSLHWRVRPVFSHEPPAMSTITATARAGKWEVRKEAHADYFFGVRWYNDGKAGQGVVDSAVTRVVTEAPMAPQKRI